MAAGAVKFEDYDIAVRDGDLVLRDLQLTGWGATQQWLKENTNNGRLWGRITTGDVLELWRTPTFDDANDQVAESDNPITEAGPVTIVESNGSGLTGSVNVDYTLGEEQLFDVVMSHASERDLKRAYGEGLAGELDDDDKYEGEDVRFESLLKETKREVINKKLWERYKDVVGLDDVGRPLFAKISDPRQIARAHALYAVSALYLRRADESSNFLEIAKKFERLADDSLQSTPIAWDIDRDGDIDDQEDHAINYIERG